MDSEFISGFKTVPFIPPSSPPPIDSVTSDYEDDIGDCSAEDLYDITGLSQKMVPNETLNYSNSTKNYNHNFINDNILIKKDNELDIRSDKHNNDLSNQTKCQNGFKKDRISNIENDNLEKNLKHLEKDHDIINSINCDPSLNKEIICENKLASETSALELNENNNSTCKENNIDTSYSTENLSVIEDKQNITVNCIYESNCNESLEKNFDSKIISHINNLTESHNYSNHSFSNTSEENELESDNNLESKEVTEENNKEVDIKIPSFSPPISNDDLCEEDFGDFTSTFVSSDTNSDTKENGSDDNKLSTNLINNESSFVTRKESNDEFSDFTSNIILPSDLTKMHSDLVDEDHNSITDVHSDIDTSEGVNFENISIKSERSLTNSDDFGDFESTNIKASVVSNNLSTIQNVRNHSSDNVSVKSEKLSNDDFGNFESTTFQTSTTYDSTDKNIENLEVVENSTLCGTGAESAFSEEEIEDDFGDFSGVETAERLQLEFSDDEEADFTSCDDESDIAQSKFGGLIAHCIPAVDESSPNSPRRAVDPPLSSLSNVVASDAFIWRHIASQDTESTPALQMTWANTLAQKAFLSALNMDARNIIFGPKWSSGVPAFAQTLSFSPLTPMKPSQQLQQSVSKPIVEHQEVSLPPAVATKEIEPKTIPPAKFDWTSSGLTNPLDSPGLERGKLSKEARPVTSLDELHPYVRKFVEALPDLSFMRSKVLMFPIRQDKR